MKAQNHGRETDREWYHAANISGFMVRALVQTSNTTYETKQSVVCFIVMPECFKNNIAAFNFKNEYKTSHMNTSKIIQRTPKIFKVENRFFITLSNLSDLLLNSNKHRLIFSLQDTQSLFQIWRDNYSEAHSFPRNFLNSSGDIAFECLPFSMVFNSLTNSFFSGSSSVGCQLMRSQKELSSFESARTRINRSNNSRLVASMRATSDQLIHEYFSSFAPNESSSDTVMLTIISPHDCRSSLSSCSILCMIPDLMTSGQLTSGIASSRAFNSDGTDTVNFIISPLYEKSLINEKSYEFINVTERDVYA